MKKRILAIAIAVALCLSLAAPALAASNLSIFGGGVESVYLKDVLSAGDLALLKSGTVTIDGACVALDLEKGILIINGTGSGTITVKDASGNVILTLYVSILGASPVVLGEGDPALCGCCGEPDCGGCWVEGDMPVCDCIGDCDPDCEICKDMF